MKLATPFRIAGHVFDDCDVVCVTLDDGTHQGRGEASGVYYFGDGDAHMIDEIELPVVLSPSVRMRIGSTSKHFTCLAIRLLAEEGWLSPDDPVRLHIPELPACADGGHFVEQSLPRNKIIA